MVIFIGCFIILIAQHVERTYFYFCFLQVHKMRINKKKYAGIIRRSRYTFATNRLIVC